MALKEDSTNQAKDALKKKIFVGAFFFVLFFVIFFGVLYVRQEIASSNSQNTQSVNFSIEKGQGLEQISTSLENAGLIKNSFIFSLYLKFEGKSERVMAGDYLIPKNLNMEEVANIITTGSVKTTRVTFPEGWTVERIATRLEEKNIVSKEEFIASTKKEYNFDFLNDRADGAGLEGYLYPDTYDFRKNITPEEIVFIMLSNFERKYNERLKNKIESNNLSFHEVITLASIVEREVAKPEDRRLVASVFLNRLKIDMPLESCATIQFITGLNKPRFTFEETRINHPYNTYIHPGLPPGPIGNPSIDSIMAVFEPENSNYLFFLSANNITHFSYTLEEHNRKAAKYLD